jgi:hypothetical protein
MSVIFCSALFLGRAAKIGFLNINHRGKTPGNKGFIYFAGCSKIGQFSCSS